MAEQEGINRRSVVKIGINFDPIPLDVGDGKIWNFTSEATPAQMDALVRVARGVGSLATVTDETVESMDFTEMTNEVSGVIADLLIEPAQKKEWIKRSYSVLAQGKVIAVLIKEMSTGFPTT